MATLTCRLCHKPVMFRSPPPGAADGKVFCGCTSAKVDAFALLDSAPLVQAPLVERLDLLFGQGAARAIIDMGRVISADPLPIDIPEKVELHPDLLALAADLLSLAASEFSNHSANHYDLPVLAPEARERLAALSNRHRWAEDEQETPDDFGPGSNGEDWCLMNALAAGLRAMAGRAP